MIEWESKARVGCNCENVSRDRGTQSFGQSPDRARQAIHLAHVGGSCIYEENVTRYKKQSS